MRGSQRQTIAERIRLSYGALTRAERQLVAALMANYPVAGLTSITEFARTGAVSTPTVMRTAKKLGFSGFPDFQAALRSELSEQLQTPLSKHERWAGDAPDAHILNRLAAAAAENLRSSLAHIDHRAFDRVAELLANPRRRVHIMGGRLTRALGDYLYRHLQVVRPGVSLIPESASLWPQALLDLGRDDLLIIFDVRRYESALHEFAGLAAKRGVKIILFTDQWMSPIASLAVESMPLRIEIPSSWDSALVTVFMIEALIAAAVDRLWPQTSGRMADLEELFAATRRFRK